MLSSARGVPRGSISSRPVAVASRIPYILSSPRLGFRCWREDDLPLAIELWSDPKVTARIGGPFTLETIRLRFEKEISQMRESGVQYWPIFMLQSGEHAGCAGLRPYRPQERIYEFGTHLRPTFWKQGLAMEAGQTVIAYAFDVLRAEALFAGHHPENDASRQLLKRLGFTYAHDELYPPTGLNHPSYLLRKT